MKFLGVEISFISLNLNFKSMVEAFEKVLFEWPLRFTSRSHVQIGPLRYSTKEDGVGVYYSLVDLYYEGKPNVHIDDLYCTSRKLRHLFRECKGTLREIRNYPERVTRLVCQACDQSYSRKDTDRIQEKITAHLRRQGKID
jgi:hypothetical protein